MNLITWQTIYKNFRLSFLGSRNIIFHKSITRSLRDHKEVIVR